MQSLIVSTLLFSICESHVIFNMKEQLILT